MAKEKLGRFGLECGCDYCQIVYRQCLLCLAPKPPGAFPVDAACNADFLVDAKPEEHDRNINLIVKRMQARTCSEDGRRWHLGKRLTLDQIKSLEGAQ